MASPLLRLLLVLPAPAPPPPPCTRPGFTADPASCTAFFHCLGPAVGYRYICPQGTRFDPSVNNCNHASLAPPCPPPTTTTTPPPGWDPSQAGAEEEEAEDWLVAPGSGFACPQPGYYPLGGTCSQFWVCREVMPGMLSAVRPFRCPTRYLFDPATHLCQRAAKVECAEPPSLFYSLQSALAVPLREDQLDRFFAAPLRLPSQPSTGASQQIPYHHHMFSPFLARRRWPVPWLPLHHGK